MKELFTPRRILLGLLLGAVAAAIVVQMLRPPVRPKLDAWTATWHELRAELPGRDALLAASDPRELCATALGRARSHEKRLFPAPDEVIESAARTWTEAALRLYTRCHTEGAHHQLNSDFDQLARIEHEIEAMLTTGN